MFTGGKLISYTQFSLVSLLVKEKLYINEVVLGTAFGIIIGPYCLNIFDPRGWGSAENRITLEVLRVVLATGLFAIGVELPQSYMADHAKGLAVMVVPTMAFGWVIVAAIIYGLFPRLNYISSLVIAACLTPTDPIISAAIVGGKFAIKHVPRNLRLILSAESAANDGLAYPFLSISIYLTVETSLRTAVGKWFLVGWLYEVILGTVIGAVLGTLFCYLMKVSYRKGFIDRESYVAQYLALALFTVGIASTIGSDDLLAAFAAGTAISWDGHFNDQTENETFSSVIDLLLNCACFVYIGAWLPFSAYNSPSLGITPWRLVILFISILLIKRIPPLLVLFKWVPEITSWKEAVFSGHFGPMGVGAIFVSTLAVTRLPEPESPPEGQGQLLAATIQTIVSFVVLGSIIVHGLSIPFFSFGKNVRSRTISISRTWTSRHNTAPDWLLWTSAAPPPLPALPEGAPADVERGSTGGMDTINEVDITDGFPSSVHHHETVSLSATVVGDPSLAEDAGGPTSLKRSAEDSTAEADTQHTSVRVDGETVDDVAASELLRETEAGLRKVVPGTPPSNGKKRAGAEIGEVSMSHGEEALPSGVRSSASIRSIHLQAEHDVDSAPHANRAVPNNIPTTSSGSRTPRTVRFPSEQ